MVRTNRSYYAWEKVGVFAKQMASPQQEMSVISMTPELQESDSLAPQDAGAVTVAQLRARIEQQCSLISMLKQRNDETFREVGSLQWQSHFFFLIRLVKYWLH